MSEYRCDHMRSPGACYECSGRLAAAGLEAASAARDLAALRAAVEALAGEWERESTYLAHQGDNAGAEHYQNRAKALRALLPAPSLPPASTVECGANPAANSGGDDASREGTINACEECGGAEGESLYSNKRDDLLRCYACNQALDGG